MFSSARKKATSESRSAFSFSTRLCWLDPCWDCSVCYFGSCAANSKSDELKAMKTQSNGNPRLIVAASDIDADMLYATKFWAGDPCIFLEQNGKRTIVLSDLEMERGRRTAKVDEFVSFNQLEREVQGKAKQAPPYERVLAHFLSKRGVKSALVPANFQLGFARALAKDNVDLATTNGLFWPEREAKTDEELKLIGRALRITETAMRRAMDVLRRSTITRDKRLKWSGKTLTSEILRAEIDTALLRAGGTPS